MTGKSLMRPQMTRYEYALICYEWHTERGERREADAYRRLLDRMTLEEAAETGW